MTFNAKTAAVSAEKDTGKKAAVMRVVGKMLIYAVLVLYALLVIFPFLVIVITSLTPEVEMDATMHFI